MNNQVLELISTYKELAKYIELDEKTGALTLNDEGWDALLKEQEEKARIADVAKMLSQAKESRFKTWDLFAGTEDAKAILASRGFSETEKGAFTFQERLNNVNQALSELSEDAEEASILRDYKAVLSNAIANSTVEEQNVISASRTSLEGLGLTTDQITAM
jgi:hypothetical protein